MRPKHKRLSPDSRASSQSPSPSSSASSYYDDSSEIDELDYRSKKLTGILKKNLNKADKRKTLLDVVRDKAWLLEDQVKLLENQTDAIRGSLQRKSVRRRVLMFAALLTSVVLVGLGINHVIHPSRD